MLLLLAFAGTAAWSSGVVGRMGPVLIARVIAAESVSGSVGRRCALFGLPSLCGAAVFVAKRGSFRAGRGAISSDSVVALVTEPMARIGSGGGLRPHGIS